MSGAFYYIYVMLKRLLSDAKYHLREWYEDLKFNYTRPDAVFPLVNSDVPGLVAKIHTLEQQHALAKEARRILRHR
jgi:hypothetical protein